MAGISPAKTPAIIKTMVAVITVEALTLGLVNAGVLIVGPTKERMSHANNKPIKPEI